MTTFFVEFPEDFDDYAWEVESKGWLPGVVVVIEDRRYTITVYDPVRLAQDIELCLKETTFFLELNLVVVPTITRDCIAAAVSAIVAENRVDSMKPD